MSCVLSPYLLLWSIAAGAPGHAGVNADNNSILSLQQGPCSHGMTVETLTWVPRTITALGVVKWSYVKAIGAEHFAGNLPTERHQSDAAPGGSSRDRSR